MEYNSVLRTPSGKEHVMQTEGGYRLKSALGFVS